MVSIVSLIHSGGRQLEKLDFIPTEEHEAGSMVFVDQTKYLDFPWTQWKIIPIVYRTVDTVAWEIILW